MTIERLITVISLPVLAIADYYLTILGKKYRDQKYNEFIRSEEYELNPVWQKDVNALKMFNYRHLIAVTLLTVYFYFSALLLGNIPYDIAYGAVCTIYLFIIARHVQNILQYRFTLNYPDELKGTITYSYVYLMKVSQYQTILFGVIFLLMNIFIRSWFLLGSSIGLFVLYLVHLRWIRRYKQKKKMLQMQQNSATIPPETK